MRLDSSAQLVARFLRVQGARHVFIFGSTVRRRAGRDIDIGAVLPRRIEPSTVRRRLEQSFSSSIQRISINGYGRGGKKLASHGALDIVLFSDDDALGEFVRYDNKALMPI